MVRVTGTVALLGFQGFLGVSACSQIEPIHIKSDFPFEIPQPPPEPEPPGYTEPVATDWTPIQGFEGEIAYEALHLGEPCMARIGLRGLPYEGNCPACEFAFDLEVDVLESYGEDCDRMNPFWTMVEDDIFKNPKLGFIEQYRAWDNVLWVGYSLDFTSAGYGYYEGPFWVIIHHDAFDNQSLSFDGELLNWMGEATVEYGYGLSDYLDYTCPFLSFVPGGPFPDGLRAEESVDCKGYTMDVFEFEATRGDIVDIAIDTVSAWTTFQPLLLVSDPDECVKAYSIGAFICEYMASPFLPCPGLTLEAPQTGTYRIIVQALADTCVDDEIAEYAVELQGASGGELRLLADDAPHYQEIRTFYTRSELDGRLLLSD